MAGAAPEDASLYKLPSPFLAVSGEKGRLCKGPTELTFQESHMRSVYKIRPFVGRRADGTHLPIKW